MTEKQEYAFVLDSNGKQLSPTKVIKAWYLIRKKRATLVNKYPMVIQLNKEVSNEEICKDEIRCGIDDGSKHTGIALVQKCQTKNKVLFKGTIEQRDDVKHLIVEVTEDTIVIIKDIDKQDLITVHHPKEKEELLQVYYRKDKRL